MVILLVKFYVITLSELTMYCSTMKCVKQGYLKTLCDADNLLVRV